MCCLCECNSTLTTFFTVCYSECSARSFPLVGDHMLYSESLWTDSAKHESALFLPVFCNCSSKARRNTRTRHSSVTLLFCHSQIGNHQRNFLEKTLGKQKYKDITIMGCFPGLHGAFSIKIPDATAFPFINSQLDFLF